MVIEIRNLPHAAGAGYMDHYRGIRSGNIIQCEDGYFAGGRGGGIVYDNAGNKIIEFPGDGGRGHQQNFIEAVRSRDRSILHSELEEGVISAELCHLANISYRSGAAASPGTVQERTGETEKMAETFQRVRSHLQANDIDMDRERIILGSWLRYQRHSRRITGGDGNTELIANALLEPTYREPFVVPNNV